MVPNILDLQCCNGFTMDWASTSHRITGRFLVLQGLHTHNPDGSDQQAEYHPHVEGGHWNSASYVDITYVYIIYINNTDACIDG